MVLHLQNAFPASNLGVWGNSLDGLATKDCVDCHSCEIHHLEKSPTEKADFYRFDHRDQLRRRVQSRFTVTWHAGLHQSDQV